MDESVDYEKQGAQAIQDNWQIYKDDESWTDESQSRDERDVVTSKQFAKWGKVFRLTGTVNGRLEDIVDILFERQGEMPTWNSTVHDCRILKVLNKDLYITYQATNEQAQGLISRRDFVNLTARGYMDGVAILAAQACQFSEMPPQDNSIRAENGITAYIAERIDDEHCKVSWILTVDLKGWIPQYLINSSLASVQLAFIEALRKRLSNPPVLPS